MSLLRIDLDLYDAQNTIDSQLLQNRGGSRRMLCDQIAEYLDRLANGTSNMNSGLLVTGAVKATGTVTFSSVVATDTVTINGTVFTCVNSGAVGNQFNKGANDTAAAASLAAFINASATANVSKNVVATSNGAVVTLTSIVPGQIGNMCTLAISAHGSVSGANLTGGSEASRTVITA